MKVKIEDQEFELISEPRHGIVRELRKQRNQMIIKLLSECRDLLDKGVISEKMKFDDAIEVIGKMKPDILTEFSQMQEEFDFIATISLATNRIWIEKELDKLTETEFWNLYERCKEVLGGSAEDFFSRYEKRTILMAKQKTSE